MSTQIKSKSLICGITGIAASMIATPSFSQQLIKAVDSQNVVSPSAINSFVSVYGVPIIVGSKPLSAPPAEMASVSPRLKKLASLIQNSGLTWHKLYRVTQASGAVPVTTLAKAQDMVDQNNQMVLSVDHVPAVDIEKLIARGDDATVTFPDGSPTGTLSLDLGDISESDAIADIAQATHTHWLAVYYLSPKATSADTPIVVTHLAYAAPLTQQEYEERYLFNGPFDLHSVPPLAPQATVTAAPPVQAGSTNPNQPAPVSVPTLQPTATTPASPYAVIDPNGYDGMMYGDSPKITYGGTTVINPF